MIDNSLGFKHYELSVPDAVRLPVTLIVIVALSLPVAPLWIEDFGLKIDDY